MEILISLTFILTIQIAFVATQNLLQTLPKDQFRLSGSAEHRVAAESRPPAPGRNFAESYAESDGRRETETATSDTELTEYASSSSSKSSDLGENISEVTCDKYTSENISESDCDNTICEVKTTSETESDVDNIISGYSEDSITEVNITSERGTHVNDNETRSHQIADNSIIELNKSSRGTNEKADGDNEILELEDTSARETNANESRRGQIADNSIFEENYTAEEEANGNFSQTISGLNADHSTFEVNNTSEKEADAKSGQYNTIFEENSSSDTVKNDANDNDAIRIITDNNFTQKDDNVSDKDDEYFNSEDEKEESIQAFVEENERDNDSVDGNSNISIIGDIVNRDLQGNGKVQFQQTIF